jgi:NAD(P)-dependent dehydrogenase (short-subunit alcohol dehydrogenase family)
LTKPVALVTNALEFAGPPAVDALQKAGFQVVVHDVAFIYSTVQANYRSSHPEVVVLAELAPEDVVKGAWSVGNRLDVLVSNDAFGAIYGPIENAEISDLQTTLDRLVVFPFGIAKASIPYLKTQPKARVVFISSNRNRLPLRGGSIPDIARAGANALIKSLSIELAPHGIPVNAIAPNFLYSETYYPKALFIEDADGRAYVERSVPMGRLAEPREIGELIHYLATMEGSFLTGAFIDFSGGWPVAPQRPS